MSNETILFLLVALSLGINMFLWWALSSAQDAILTNQIKLKEIFSYLIKLEKGA